MQNNTTTKPLNQNRMKNIHLLPTNPNDETGGVIWVKKTRDWCNIYITSNENLKEGDWVLTPTNDVIQWAKVFRPDGEKIIITTAQDLIKDGVQAIDDDFLEWFVKNPTCEFIDVKKQYITPLGDVVDNWFDNGGKTVEVFEAGAKWQAERMYSEEEVLKILHNYRNHFEIYRNIQVLPDVFFPWFEQFKKK